jgi:hypothetical protein
MPVSRVIQQGILLEILCNPIDASESSIKSESLMRLLLHQIPRTEVRVSQA